MAEDRYQKTDDRELNAEYGLPTDFVEPLPDIVIDNLFIL